MAYGQTIFSPDSGNIPQPFEFAGDTVEGEDIGTTAAGTLNYGPMTISHHPIRPYKLEISIPGLNLRAVDDGAGKLIGYDIQGDVNYSTGVVNLELKDNPGSAQTIFATYSSDFEASDDIPKIGMKFTSKSINARIWALKDTIGLEQSYALKRRFGLVAEDEVASELVAAINSEIVSTAVRMLLAKSQGNVDWPKAAPAGISYFEHKQSFKDALQQAEAVILGNSGRGTVNIVICGRRVSAVIGTLPGFKKISDGASIGPHIYGTLDGVTIVRVPNDYVLDADKAICVYRGVSSFEAALVYSPYMPLVVTTALPAGNNPLNNQKAAAIWAGLDVLVPNFISTISLT
jgi:predicted Rdx family selenoprotein